MRIAKASPADFDQLVTIGHKFFEFNPYRHDSSIDESSLKETFWQLVQFGVLLVVLDDYDKVVGTAAAFIAPLYWNRSELQGLEAFWWVDPEYRASGIGKKLRIRLQEEAALRGVKFWSMIALEDSEPDKVGAMYQRAGLKPVERVYMKVI